jgi:hypothetical protein
MRLDGASFCKRLTSQAENVPRSIDAAIVNRTAIVASPFPYFEALRFGMNPNRGGERCNSGDRRR